MRDGLYKLAIISEVEEGGEVVKIINFERSDSRMIYRDDNKYGKYLKRLGNEDVERMFEESEKVYVRDNGIVGFCKEVK